MHLVDELDPTFVLFVEFLFGHDRTPVPLLHGLTDRVCLPTTNCTKSYSFVDILGFRPRFGVRHGQVSEPVRYFGFRFKLDFSSFRIIGRGAIAHSGEGVLKDCGNGLCISLVDHLSQ